MHTHAPAMEAFGRLMDIMDELRAKCPWDKKQTFDSLKNLTIEETYELVDAIMNKDMGEIEEEVGDLMLHMVFYAKLGSESATFDMHSILTKECEKLIERHPHIYGDVKAETEEEVKQNWEKIKLKSGKKSVLQGVPKSLPAMVKAYRIQEKTAQLGFDWPDWKDVWNKVHEEMGELQAAFDQGSDDEITDELGDVLFSLINLARKRGIDPEAALASTNRKFMSRWKHMESTTGQDLSELNLAEMDELWNQAKSEERKK